VGGNEEAARLSGVRETHEEPRLHVQRGLAVWPACVRRPRNSRAIRKRGVGKNSTAIAIVVSAELPSPERGAAFGLTLLGTLKIGYLEKVLIINACQASPLMLTGAIIVVAVLTQRRRRG